MKKAKNWGLVFLVFMSVLLCFASQKTFAQDVFIPDISGITFNKSSQDTSYPVADPFTLHSMQVLPIDLTVMYDVDADQFSIFGLLVLVVGSDSVATSLGDQKNPGFKTENDKISQVIFTPTKDFTIAGLGFSPRQMTFKYDVTNDRYVMFGIVQVNLEQDKIDALLGDESDPGVIIEDGGFDQVDIGVTDAFSLKNLRITPSEFTFMLEPGVNRYMIFGTVNLETLAGERFAPEGDDSEIIAKIVDGAVSELSFSLTDPFQLRWLNIKPSDMQFEWEQDRFVIYGKATVTLEGDSLDAALGNKVDPGIEIVDGTIEHINIDITSDFYLNYVQLTQHNLTFKWDDSSSSFIMYGDARLVLQGTSFQAQLGSASNPGLQLIDGAIDHITFTFSDAFNVEALSVTPIDMTLAWAKERNKQAYVMYGDATVTTAGGDIFTGDFGSAKNAEIYISFGLISFMSLNISAEFNLKQLQYEPVDVYFEWDRNRQRERCILYGEAYAIIEGDYVGVQIGDQSKPGAEFIKGVVDSITMDISDPFVLKDLRYSPIDLELKWGESQDKYTLYGKTMVSIEDDNLNIAFGDSLSPGIELTNGSLDFINIDVADPFTLNDLQFLPHNITFRWDKAQDKYVMFGDVTAVVEGDSLEADLGSSANPGIEIADGTVEFINLGLTAKFRLKELQFAPDGLSFAWDKTQKLYKIFGAVTTTTNGGDAFTGQLGSAETPGIEILNGSVDFINIDVTADFHLKGLDFIPHNMTFEWIRATDEYIMYGNIDVTTEGGDSFHGQLGDRDDPGIEIVNGKVDHIYIGVTADFTMKQLQFTPTDLTFKWDKSSDHYLIYGDVSIAIEDDHIDGHLGTSDAPGIEIVNGGVNFINVGVDAEFTLKSLQITPNNLTFTWDKVQDIYLIYGDISAKVEGDVIDASLGDKANPGIEIIDGALDHINISATDDFHLKGLQFMPRNLTFEWDKTNDKFVLFGDADVSIEGDSMDVELGDTDNPGIEIVNGAVELINMGVYADFQLKDMTFTPTDLTFVWDKQQNQYIIYGDVTATTLGGDVFDGQLGSDADPGIIIRTGSLEHIRVGISADFKLNGLSFAPSGLTLEWTSDSDNYIIYGEVTVTTVGGDSFDGHLGNADDPGIEIVDGSVEHINVGVTAVFNLKALTFSPKDLTFQWGANDDKYVIFGEVSITTQGGDLFDGRLGDAENPGVAIVNGSVQHINLGVTANFDLHGLTFAPKRLTFEWDKQRDLYLIYGDVLVAVESDSINAQLGDQADPGIEIINGVVDHINLSVTADFHMKGLQIAPQDLTLEWDKNANKYVFYGEIDVNLEGDTFDALLGDQSDPGLEIIDGQVDHINIGITADFHMKGLEFAPKHLTFEWDKAQDKYLIYGQVAATMEGDTFDALLGDHADPGIEIINGAVDHINLGVTADFNLKGLDINPQDLTIEWDSAEYGNSSVNRYLFYGALNLNIDGDIIDAGFGTKKNPGLLLENGVIKHILIDINSDLKFGNLEVETKDLTLEYQNKIYHLTGTMLAKDVWKAEINLGKGNQAGVELDVAGEHDTFILEDVIFLIEHAELGSIDFKRIELEFKNNTIADCDLYVSFPPGWEVEGDIKFVGNPAKVHEVILDWEAENIEEAIEIPGTGAVLMYIKGDINNIDRPSELTFTGDIGLTYGGPFDVDGHELTLIHIDDSVEISKSYLKVGGDIGIGSYQSGSTWHNVLGYGDVNFHFYWHDYYKIYGKFKIPNDPMIEASADVLISDSGNFDALVDVEFIVPHFVPYIHGKHFGSVDGAIRYLHGHSTHSYAAGWTKVDLWLTSFHIGAKYNLGTKHFSEIGSGTIKHIKKDIHRDEGLSKTNSAAGGFTTLTQTFELAAPSPTFARIHLGWPTVIDTAYVTVTGPEGHLNLIPITVQDDGDSTSMPIITAGENLTTVVNDTTVEFLLAANSSIRTESDAEKAPLAPGQYRVGFYYQGALGIDSMRIRADRLYPQPTGSITAKENKDGSIDLDISYNAYIPDSCIVSIFWNDSTNYNGRLVAHLPYGEIAGDGSGSTVYNFVPAELHADEDLLFYMVIDDHINTPFYSDFTPTVVYDPPIYGNIQVVDADSLRSGITVFIDDSGNGKFDINSDSTEACCITDGDGDFSFHRLDPDNYCIDIVVPNGYELDASSPNSMPVNINYDGQPIELNFMLRKSQ